MRGLRDIRFAPRSGQLSVGIDGRFRNAHSVLTLPSEPKGAGSALHRFEYLGGIGMHVELYKLVAAYGPDMSEMS